MHHPERYKRFEKQNKRETTLMHRTHVSFTSMWHWQQLLPNPGVIITWTSSWHGQGKHVTLGTEWTQSHAQIFCHRFHLNLYQQYGITDWITDGWNYRWTESQTESQMESQMSSSNTKCPTISWWGTEIWKFMSFVMRQTKWNK